jgi:hypothetical protein
MAAWSDFYPFILPVVRGCDSDVVDFHTRQAAIEFCRRSQCWRVEIPIGVVVDQPTYVLPVPDGASISKLHAAVLLNVDGVECDEFKPVPPAFGREMVRNNRSGSLVFLSDDGLSLTVSPTPSVAGAQILASVALKPSQASATFPDFLFEQYVDAIAAGALARLLDLPRTNWRDTGEAQTQRNKFTTECGNASARTSRGGASSHTRSRGMFF